jgi:hypothetical protein
MGQPFRRSRGNSGQERTTAEVLSTRRVYSLKATRNSETRVSDSLSFADTIRPQSSRMRSSILRLGGMAPGLPRLECQKQRQSSIGYKVYGIDDSLGEML